MNYSKEEILMMFLNNIIDINTCISYLDEVYKQEQKHKKQSVLEKLKTKRGDQR